MRFARGTVPVPARLRSRARGANFWLGASWGGLPGSYPRSVPPFGRFWPPSWPFSSPSSSAHAREAIVGVVRVRARASDAIVRPVEGRTALRWPSPASSSSLMAAFRARRPPAPLCRPPRCRSLAAPALGASCAAVGRLFLLFFTPINISFAAQIALLELKLGRHRRSELERQQTKTKRMRLLLLLFVGACVAFCLHRPAPTQDSL